MKSLSLLFSKLKKVNVINQYRGLRRELYVLFACRLIDNAGSLVGPMLTLILSKKIGMSAGEIAAYFLVYSFIALPFQLLGGKLTDKVNKKLLINIGDFASSIIYIVCGFIGINKVTVAVYLAGGLLQTIEGPAYESLIADFTTAADRDKAYSLSYLGMNLGLVLAPTIGGLMLDNYIELMFILSGTFELVSIILFDIFVRDISAIHDEGNIYEKDAGKANIFTVLWDNKVIIFLLFIMSFSWLFYNMYGYLLPLTLSEIHPENGSVLFGTVSSLNCVTVLVFTAIVTSLLSKKTTIFKMVLGNVFEFSGLAVIFLLLGRPVFYYIGIVIFTIGEIINTTSTNPHLTRRIPINCRGRILALSSVMGSVIISVGEYYVGKICDVSGFDAAWYVVFGIGIISTLGYIVMAPFDKKRYPLLYGEHAN